MVKCPYYGFEGGFKSLKAWRFGFYDVSMPGCPKCCGVFNYYSGTGPREGRVVEFPMGVGPRSQG